MSTIESQPISEIDQEVVAKLASRYGISPSRLAGKHVLFFADVPAGVNIASAHVISAAVIVDKPVKLEVVGLGTALKSRADEYDPQRGYRIALARAIQAAAV